jgi:hypothetical protein
MIVKECGEEILFYLKYEKYTSVLFFLMFIPNSILIWVYVQSSYDEGSAFESFIQRFTLRSLIDLDTGITDNQYSLWAPLIAFIAHIMLQHIMIYLYKMEIDVWVNQNVKEVRNKNKQMDQKHLRDNSITVYGLNQEDDPKLVHNFLSN